MGKKVKEVADEVYIPQSEFEGFLDGSIYDPTGKATLHISYIKEDGARMKRIKIIAWAEE